MVRLAVCLAFLASLVLTACSEREAACEAPTRSAVINPNGDSELALLMRSMFDEGMRLKEDVASGKRPLPSWDAKAIFTAHATQPAKVATPEFKAFAQSFLQSARAIESAAPDQYRQSYQTMVQSCIACHQEVCPGPIARIRKMALPDEE